MTVALHHIVIDAHDLPRLARFWSEVLDWNVLSERDREIVIGPDAEADPEGNEFCVLRPKRTLIS